MNGDKNFFKNKIEFSQPTFMTSMSTSQNLINCDLTQNNMPQLFPNQLHSPINFENMSNLACAHSNATTAESFVNQIDLDKLIDKTFDSAISQVKTLSNGIYNMSNSIKLSLDDQKQNENDLTACLTEEINKIIDENCGKNEDFADKCLEKVSKCEEVLKKQLEKKEFQLEKIKNVLVRLKSQSSKTVKNIEVLMEKLDKIDAAQFEKKNENEQQSFFKRRLQNYF